jgi:glutamyl/glutaminyl-tRNA synthetase
MMEDLRWFGFRWQEGPDCGGPYAPYSQSERMDSYRAGFEKLRPAKPGLSVLLLAPGCHARIASASRRRGRAGLSRPVPAFCQAGKTPKFAPAKLAFPCRGRRGRSNLKTAAAGRSGLSLGRDFGDFVVWRHDDVPSYQLAVVLDDAAMRISEVVRGEDLLLSTARQWLLYEALGLAVPAFYHCPLLTDAAGRRLAKRDDALSLRALREQGLSPDAIRRQWTEIPIARQSS